MTFDFSGLAISILSSHNLLLPLASYFSGSLCINLCLCERVRTYLFSIILFLCATSSKYAIKYALAGKWQEILKNFSSQFPFSGGETGIRNIQLVFMRVQASECGMSCRHSIEFYV